jgi:hypothetical protein
MLYSLVGIVMTLLDERNLGLMIYYVRSFLYCITIGPL